MDIHTKKNDTRSGKRREKDKTTCLAVNKPKKISKRKRQIRKKKNREKTKKHPKYKQGKFGEVWIWEGIEPESKYLFPQIIGKRTRKNGSKLMQAIKNMRANKQDKLLIQSDNFDAYESIVKECFSKKITKWVKRRGEMVVVEAEMPDNILYAVLTKNRTSLGDIEGIDAKIVFGKPTEILKIITDHKDTNNVNTNYIERSNLNRRTFNARLNRKTLKFSKDYDCLEAQLNLQRIYSNFCWNHRTLSQDKDTIFFYPLPCC